MAAGLQVWDANGNLIVDHTTRLLKFLGTLSVGSSYTASTQSGSLYVPLWAAHPGNTPFFAKIAGGFNTDGTDAVFYIDGATLYWQFPVPGTSYNSTYNYWINRPDQTIVYGLF